MTPSGHAAIGRAVESLGKTMAEVEETLLRENIKGVANLCENCVISRFVKRRTGLTVWVTHQEILTGQEIVRAKAGERFEKLPRYEYGLDSPIPGYIFLYDSGGCSSSLYEEEKKMP